MTQESWSSNQFTLYVGYEGDLYKETFIPRYFSGPIHTLDWPKESKRQSIRAIKETVFRTVQSGLCQQLVISLDHDPLFYYSELKQLSDLVPIVGVFGDDTNMPNFSSQLSLLCTKVLTTDPLQVDRYLALGVPVSLHLFDVNPERYQDSKSERDVDVLLFGTGEKARRDEITWLTAEMSHLRVVDVTDHRVPFDQLLQLLNRSKLTINWNWVWQSKLPSTIGDPLYRNYTQPKGRIFEAALSGCLPLSTWNPAQQRVFGPSLPTFSSRVELHELIARFVNDEQLRCERLSELRARAVQYIDWISETNHAVHESVRSAAPRSAPVVDKTVATYRFLAVLVRLRRLEWSLLWRDVFTVRLHRVSWRYILLCVRGKMRF